MDQVVTSIMFADDLVLFSNTQKDLQHSLSVLEKYCSTWDLKSKEFSFTCLLPFFAAHCVLNVML